MAVTGSQRADRSLHLSQIEKIENSHTLHSSDSLRKLFRYLADHSIEHPGTPLKEYQIATEVFGRPADFDPQFDSAIRVQAGRLRQKLSEYYATEGVGDSIQVEMPKGGYLLSFHPKRPESSKLQVIHPENGEPKQSVAPPSRSLWIAIVCLSTLLVAAIVALAVLVPAARQKNVIVTNPLQGVPPEIATFWKPFVSGAEEPWVIFSNGAFVGRPETGMRYYSAARDTRSQTILDHYTGVGEVLAIHNLDRVFNLLHRQIRVKRGSLFSLDDAKNNDLIFVGSPAENLTLRDIPGTKEFVFQRPGSGERKGDLGIANLHPLQNEPRYFFGTPADKPLAEDYAVLALVKGLDPARSVLIMAGTTTMGTQAAVEFACNENSLHELLQKIHADSSGVKPFEAVLHVKVTRGVPVETTIVAVRSTQ